MTYLFTGLGVTGGGVAFHPLLRGGGVTGCDSLHERV